MYLIEQSAFNFLVSSSLQIFYYAEIVPEWHLALKDNSNPLNGEILT